MQITIIAPVLGEENNGTTVATMNLVRHMKNKGHKVNIVCVDKDKKGTPGYFVVPRQSLGPVDFLAKANNVVIGKADKKIIRAACEGSDIVHVTIPMFLGAKCGKFVKEELGIPLTAGFHCQAENFTSHILNLMDSKWFNDFIYRHYHKRLYRYCDAIHYPTDFIRRVYEGATEKTNGYVISNGVKGNIKPMKVERDAKYDGKKVILFTGRIAKEKSHKILVKAVSLSKYESDIQLIFAGQGPRQKRIERLSKKLLTNQPEIGFFPIEKLNNIINSADLYVHPAEIEIEAIACLEAIKCGLVPVIANSPKCATKAFALDERSLFKVNDPKDLSNKIDYWFDHQDELNKMKQEYAQNTCVMNVEECMEQMEKMFEDVINSAK
ncbi:MAG: glycosyltransferase [Erysipelotrichaceae bacterium]|jgi:glycosyltransferase involved in cell wall biosynthesis|nr:glycosyltransferase [Erysipelotrichaceae bacterium]